MAVSAMPLSPVPIWPGSEPRPAGLWRPVLRSASKDGAHGLRPDAKPALPALLRGGVSIPESELGRGRRAAPSSRRTWYTASRPTKGDSRSCRWSEQGSHPSPADRLQDSIGGLELSPSGPERLLCKNQRCKVCGGIPAATLGYIVVRYRTFEKPAPHVRTVGGLSNVGSVFQAVRGW